MEETIDVARRMIAAFLPRPSVLRRRSDRIEVAARWVALVVVAIVLPVALALGSDVSAQLGPRVALEQAERHRVSARVLAAPEHEAGRIRSDVAAYEGRAPVRWIAADGAAMVDTVRVPADARPGDTRVLWVDRKERPAPAPLTSANAVARGASTTLGVMVAAGLAAALLVAALRWVLDRRRLREWERDWRRFTDTDHRSSH